MRLWTTQSLEVYNQVMEKGWCVANPESSTLLRDGTGRVDMNFVTAYDWMVTQMDKRISRPFGYDLKCPWWAYYKLNGNDNLSLSDIDCLDAPGDTLIALELEVPDNEVVLSDLELWHYVLNDSWIDDSESEDEWEVCSEYYSGLPEQIAQRVKVESWSKVFDLTPIDTEWRRQGFDVQATFWLLKKEYIVSATKFVVRDILEILDE